LAILPPQVEDVLWQVATERGQLALILLLTKYYLRPKQIVSARLGPDGLIVTGFDRPIGIDPSDNDVVGEWLSRKRRPRTAQAVRNALSALRSPVVSELEVQNHLTGASTDWQELLDIGIGALRRFARERHAETSNYEEAVYCDLLHNEDADPYDNLRWLSQTARRILTQASRQVVVEIKQANERMVYPQ
jgi:succinate dehydrogenase flavin-adding protein (antitoxin of CptAB toxin-antitoxin module)